MLHQYSGYSTNQGVAQDTVSTIDPHGARRIESHVGSGLLTIKNFATDQFGIRLVEEGTYGAATRSEFLKIDHYQQVGNNPDGTPIYEPVYAAFFDDGANDQRNGMLYLGGLPTLLGDENNLIYAGGGTMGWPVMYGMTN